jgi:hypothetical protein
MSTDQKLKKIVAAAIFAGGVCLTAVAAPVANADPTPPSPPSSDTWDPTTDAYPSDPWVPWTADQRHNFAEKARWIREAEAIDRHNARIKAQLEAAKTMKDLNQIPQLRGFEPVSEPNLPHGHL